MSTEPITVEIGTRMEDALLMMESLNVTSLVVQDKGAIKGVIKSSIENLENSIILKVLNDCIYFIIQ